MGVFAYSSPETTLADDSIVNNQSTDKSYFVLDDIEIMTLLTVAPPITSRSPDWINVNNVENISIKVKLNVYPSYEERLLRNNLLMSTEYSLQDLIDKNFSENLWTKCYIKIKELILNQSTESLKEALTLRKREEYMISPLFITDPNTGIKTAVALDEKDTIVDTIPAEYQYLLEIDDHFN